MSRRTPVKGAWAALVIDDALRAAAVLGVAVTLVGGVYGIQGNVWEVDLDTTKGPVTVRNARNVWEVRAR